jgi:hypothetical protein
VLEPAAVGQPAASGAPHVQIREVGIAHKVVWLEFDSSSRAAVTIDARSGSAGPVELDVAGSRIEYQSRAGVPGASAAAVAAGEGALPSRVRLREEKVPPLTITSRGRTFWIVFDRVEAIPDDLVRTVVKLRFAGMAAPVEVVVTDLGRGRPEWHPSRTSATGLTARLQLDELGTSPERQYAGSFGVGLLHARGAWRLGLGAAIGAAYERAGAVYERAGNFTGETSVAWRPATWALGPFLAGQVRYLDFETGAISSRRWSPAVIAGAEVPSDAGGIPTGFMRIGVFHELDAPASPAWGVSFALHLRFWRW